LERKLIVVIEPLIRDEFVGVVETDITDKYEGGIIAGLKDSERSQIVEKNIAESV
jgi:hypothetical protein